MKHLIFKIILLGMPYFLTAQKKEKKTRLDTLKMYDCLMSRTQEGEKVSYKINDIGVTAEQYKKIKVVNDKIEKCNPCYLKTYTVEETLISTGIMYFPCPKGTKAVPVVLENNNSVSISEEADFCKHGEWKYYDASGKVTSVEKYEFGKEIK